MEWNIQSRAHACQSCKKQFADKEAFHTMLFDEKAGYNRFDVCQDCWTAQYSQGANDRKGFVSYWQSIYTVPPAAPTIGTAFAAICSETTTPKRDEMAVINLTMAGAVFSSTPRWAAYVAASEMARARAARTAQ